jgi:hypothetical protein
MWAQILGAPDGPLNNFVTNYGPADASGSLA